MPGVLTPLVYMTNSKYNPYGFDLLKGQNTVHRALLIAYAGNFTVQLMDTQDLEENRRVRTDEITPALQEMLSPQIKIIWNNEQAVADICVELSQPTYDMLHRAGNVTQLLVSDMGVLKGRHITFDLPLNNLSHELLRNAYNRLRLKVNDAYLIQRIASVIACMDSDIAPTKVEAHHVAEAINYQISKYENG